MSDTSTPKAVGKNGNVAPAAPKGNRYNEQHGLSALKKAWSRLGNRMIDGRSPAAVALRKWRAELVDDLGGPDNMSAQKETIIDLACRSRLLLHSVDTWLFEQESLVYKSKKRLATLLPVVVQRQALADGLAKYMNMLGLERRHRVKTLQDILNAEHDNGNVTSEEK
jgi:hypothetical protein